MKEYISGFLLFLDMDHLYQKGLEQAFCPHIFPNIGLMRGKLRGNAPFFSQSSQAHLPLERHYRRHAPDQLHERKRSAMYDQDSVLPHFGKSVVSLAGIGAACSFLVMPWITLGPLGNYTAVQVIELANQELRLPQVTFLWLALLLSGIITVLGLMSFLVPRREHLISILVMGLGVLALGGMITLYAIMSQQYVLTVSAKDFLGSGFWIYTVSVVVAIIGCLIQLVHSSLVRGNRRFS
jgi:hypothetical protein